MAAQRTMPPIFHIASSHEEAAEWDVLQHTAIPPEERQAVARVLKARAYPGPNKDVRECHREG